MGNHVKLPYTPPVCEFQEIEAEVVLIAASVGAPCVPDVGAAGTTTASVPDFARGDDNVGNAFLTTFVFDDGN